MSKMIIWSLFNIVLVLGLLGLWIYGFILFVKLAHRGIKALDLYIEEKGGNNRNF
ncbi:hypothetical protein [Clostridium intestinale]|uniref:Uncharacterized protein n=1 Tax=Clostridium intestinale DSM 6191 TaxID=1121320 RepID=A0A1M5W236_9CLOT|nr:hypothetical protein [Clostridium intestinale]SHH81562.1 hypothetical protein SAMN02745941_00890 [Clostridium intestinale DSM 6191]